MEPILRIGKIDEFRPAEKNANDHTPRGEAMLETSMQRVGYVAPMTSAKDGEMLDGSDRLVSSADRFGEDVIVIEHDGTKPIIAVRVDVPNAKTQMAKEIALYANRVAEVNLAWNNEVLADIAQELDLSGMWSKSELNVPEIAKGGDGHGEGGGASGETEQLRCPRCGYVFEDKNE